MLAKEKALEDQHGGKLTAAEQNGIAVKAEGGGEEERVSRRSTEDVIGAEDAMQVTSQQRQSLCQPTPWKAGMCVQGGASS